MKIKLHIVTKAIISLITFLAIASCKPAAFDIDSFEKRIVSMLDGKTIGYSYSISENGKIARKGAGGYAVAPWDTANNSGIPHSEYKRQDLASTSKTITAITLLNLLQEKQLDENSLLVKYLPAYWQPSSPTFLDLTFKMMLRHESGMTPGGIDFYSLKGRAKQNSVWTHGTYAYQNINFAFLRIAIAYLSHQEELRAIEGSYPTNLAKMETALESRINQIYIDEVNKRVFSKAGIAYSYPRPNDEENPTLDYNFKTTDPGWNKGDMTRYAGSAGWRLSSMEMVLILTALKHTDDLLNADYKQKMFDGLLGWQRTASVTVKGGISYGHGGYYQDKYSPNASPEPKGRGCYTAYMIFPNGIEVAAQTNSLGGTSNMENVLLAAYDRAWQ